MVNFNLKIPRVSPKNGVALSLCPMRWPSSVKSVIQDPKSLLVLENGVFVYLLYHDERQGV